jgi:hypothetical protein
MHYLFCQVHISNKESNAKGVTRMIGNSRKHSGGLRLLFTAGLAFMMLSCATTYYRAMESFGVHKRDILVDRVEDARDSQEEAGEQFRTALEKFRDVVDFEGGKLESRYNRLQAEYDRSEAKALEVRRRIDSVEKVAEDLFDEWKNELKEYTDDGLRRSSESKLRQTRRNCSELIDAMRRAEAKMPPVLARLKDQVLFLKHNLNAQAIGSLKGVSTELQGDVDDLLRELERSISEANKFIEELI